MSGVYAVLVYGLVYIALPYIVPLFISEQVEMVCGYARTYITICGMFFIPLGMMHGASVTVSDFLLANLVPATLGNIAGGAVFVGGIYWYINK